MSRTTNWARIHPSESATFDRFVAASSFVHGTAPSRSRLSRQCGGGGLPQNPYAEVVDFSPASASTSTLTYTVPPSNDEGHVATSALPADSLGSLFHRHGLNICLLAEIFVRPWHIRSGIFRPDEAPEVVDVEDLQFAVVAYS